MFSYYVIFRNLFKLLLLYICYMVIMKSITKVSKEKEGNYIKKIKDNAEKRNPTLAALDKIGSNEAQQIYGYIVTFSSN